MKLIGRATVGGTHFMEGNNKSVCVDLIGRLGNNLFQIAMCVGYAEKHGCEYWIPDWSYAHYFKNNFTKQSKGTVFVGEKGWYYEDLPFTEDVKFFGFFQSYKYFEHSQAKIRELFQFNDQITNKYTKLGENTCSIHVRRGDYIGNFFHEVCHLEYYKEAIAEIETRTDIDVFVVFSDDIAWCKENFVGEKFLFVENNSDIVDLFLMSKCSHNIICNSTFSWWAAWLNDNQKKIVIAPEKWFGDVSRGTEDLLPDEWIKLKIK